MGTKAGPCTPHLVVGKRRQVTCTPARYPAENVETRSAPAAPPSSNGGILMGKNAKMCGTPGCKLEDFHDGPCTSHLVVGKRHKATCAPACSPAEKEKASEPEYGVSVSKEMQRLRIATEVLNSSTDAANAPTLVFVASHTGSDSKFFESLVGKKLPRETSLVAVNKGSIAYTPKTKRLVKVEQSSIEDFADAAPTDSITHIWLDLTEQEISMRLLWNAVRILQPLGKAGAVAPGQLFVNLSKRCHTFEASATIFLAQCSAAGLSVNHIEEYTGVTQEGVLSRKRNMLFFSCAVTSPQLCNGVFDENLNAMGCIVWVDCAACQTGDAMEHGLSKTFVGVACGYASRKSILVRFFNPYGLLRSDKWTVPFNAVKHLSPWSSPPSHRP